MKYPLERIRPEDAGITSKDIRTFFEKVQHDKTEIHGVMAAIDGKVFAEGWLAPFGSEFPHSCHSMGKSYVCTAIGIACTEGLMSMSDRIADIFADEIKAWNVEQTAAFQRLTVWHVVTMTNGMRRMSELTDDWIYRYLINPVEFEPGEQFLYNTAGSCLLAVIIKKVTGKDVFAYLTEKLFCKIGIDPESIVWLKFHDGNIAEPGCFSLTENNLRMGMLYVNGGMWNGEQIIDSQWIADALSAQVDNSSMPGGEDSHCGYGYQLWKCLYPGTYRFDGGQGQYCIMIPEKKIVVAINQGGVEPYGPSRTLEMVYRYLFDKMSENSVEYDDEEFAKFEAYLKTLAVNDDKPNEYFPDVDNFTGEYHATEGSVTPWIGVSPGGFNFFESFYDMDKKKEMSEFALKVEKEYVRFEAAGYAFFEAWFDGKIRVHETDSVLPKLRRTYSTASFLDDDTLQIQIHWISGWFITIMTFHKEADGSYSISASKNILDERRPYFTDYGKAIKC